MIFAGDTVLPWPWEGASIKQLDQRFLLAPKIVNMEGAMQASGIKKTSGVALASHNSFLSMCQSLNIKAVCSANNHISDYDIDFDNQEKMLAGSGVGYFGSGENIEAASRPFICEDERLVVLNFGWRVIGCKYAGVSSPGVNPYSYPWILQQVKACRKSHPDKKLVCVFHWNYEFEQYPQPADREFSKLLIDEGVFAIVGHHAHIIQGFEYYKGRPIFYGLGNLYFPNASYGGIDVNFPDSTQHGLSVDLVGDDVSVYVTKLVDNNRLIIDYFGKPEQCERLMNASRFQGLSAAEYLQFFKRYRVKKKMLPIYKSYNRTIENKLNDLFVMGRQIPVDFLCRLRGFRS